MESVKKSIDKRALHKREYDNWVNERQMQTTEEKVDTGKALDVSLVDTESSGTESKEQDTSSSSGNDAHVDDADIRPIYDEEPMAEERLTRMLNNVMTQVLCVKCVFNANHDSCVTKFLNEVNSRAKVPSNKTTNKNKPIEQTSVARKPERQIPKDICLIKKTFAVHEKTMTHRSCLRWKSTGKIFKSVVVGGFRTEKIFTSSTTKVDSEPTNGLNDDI
nr:hypothetical protein [Tanacetum cinerariifolium]